MKVTVHNASLDTTPQGRVVIRGSIDPTSLGAVMVADYQREVLGGKSQEKLVSAIQDSTVPDVELGCRSENFEYSGSSIIVNGPVYVIDGLQRISAAKQMIATSEMGVPYIGALIHLGTNEEWERARFRALNADRSKLSPNVLLKNSRYDYVSILMLYMMTTEDPAFIMNNRVQWSQKARISDLITANTLFNVARRINTPLGSGLRTTSGGLIAFEAFDRAIGEHGEATIQANIRTFFELIDECWGVTGLDGRDRAIQLRGTFLNTFASVLADHTDFWRDGIFFMPVALRATAKRFNNGSHLGKNCAGGNVNELLYGMLVRHINSGKRTKHITLRPNEYAKGVKRVVDEEMNQDE